MWTSTKARRSSSPSGLCLQINVQSTLRKTLQVQKDTSTLVENESESERDYKIETVNFRCDSMWMASRIIQMTIKMNRTNAVCCRPSKWYSSSESRNSRSLPWSFFNGIHMKLCCIIPNCDATVNLIVIHKLHLTQVKTPRRLYSILKLHIIYCYDFAAKTRNESKVGCPIIYADTTTVLAIFFQPWACLAAQCSFVNSNAMFYVNL